MAFSVWWYFTAWRRRTLALAWDMDSWWTLLNNHFLLHAWQEIYADRMAWAWFVSPDLNSSALAPSHCSTSPSSVTCYLRVGLAVRNGATPFLLLCRCSPLSTFRCLLYALPQFFWFSVATGSVVTPVPVPTQLPVLPFFHPSTHYLFLFFLHIYLHTQAA